MSGSHLCWGDPRSCWGLRRSIAPFLGCPRGRVGDPAPSAGRQRPVGGGKRWVHAPRAPPRHRGGARARGRPP
eukprot:12241343-Alexandrium_andersonii.AAC.1